MTCIVGLEHNGKVWIGGDSAGNAGWDQQIRSDEKVFRNGPFLMGFTSSFRMGQLLRYSFAPPEQTVDDDYKYLCSTFVAALIECLSEGSWLSKKQERAEGGAFLLGYHGSLYRVESDFQVGKTSCGYDAVGCGESLALGALYVSRGGPRRRIEGALNAASFHSSGVAAPFTVLVA